MKDPMDSKIVEVSASARVPSDITDLADYFEALMTEKIDGKPGINLGGGLWLIWHRYRLILSNGFQEFSNVDTYGLSPYAAAILADAIARYLPAEAISYQNQIEQWFSD